MTIKLNRKINFNNKRFKKRGYKSDDITILTRNSQSLKNIFENEKLESFGLTQDPPFEKI